MTATVLNTKIDEVENKIPNDSKYVTIHKFNKFIGKTFDTKLKQAKLVASSSNTVLDLANKNKLKIEKLQTFDSNYFLGKIYFGGDGSQNRFISQYLL